MAPTLVGLVYNGPGASVRSVHSLVRSLERCGEFTVRTVSATEVTSDDESWRSADLFVFPGGADLPYVSALGPVGMQRIRSYVEQGGVYLGFCAGAYFASGAVSFEAGTKLEVVGERHLKFYRGTAAGAAFPGFDYESERGAVAAKIKYKNVAGELSTLCALALFHSLTRASVCYSPIRSLARSPGLGEWTTCLDYVNGGPYWMIDDTDDAVFRINSVNHQRLDGIEVLAAYEDLNHAVAAMRCRVGEGVAVLCGSHPEIHHDDIADAPEGSEELYVEHVARLKENLRQHEDSRAEFFRNLVTAGLRRESPVIQ